MSHCEQTTKEHKSTSSPLATVRQALEGILTLSLFNSEKERAQVALAALSPLERVLNAVASITDEQWEALRVACYRNHRALTSGAGAEGPCACSMRNGTSKACDALRALQAMRVEGTS